MNLPGHPDHAAPPEAYDVIDPGAVEPKTKAATVGAGAGAILSAFFVWGADELFFNGPAAPDVPAPVVGAITLVVTGLCTFIPSYLARHVQRSS